MKAQLIKMIVEGSAEDRDKAGLEICQSKMLDLHDDLQILLNHHDEKIREIAVIILGVFGQEQSIDQLKSMSKSDPSACVRVAAIIAREYAGKLTYEQLKTEIRRFRKGSQPDEDESEEAEKADTSRKNARPRVRSIADLEEEAKGQKGFVFSLHGISGLLADHKIKMIAAASVVLIVFIGIRLFPGSDVIAPEKVSKIGSKAIGESIIERIEGISEFKSRWLHPESPESRYPMTLELRTIEGDTYGSLFERVYGSIFSTNVGMNTLGAFWRNINFGLDPKHNDEALMGTETEGELLLFPNLPAMHVLMQVGEGDAAYQGLNNADPDISIQIEIDNVTVK